MHIAIEIVAFLFVCGLIGHLAKISKQQDKVIAAIHKNVMLLGKLRLREDSKNG